MIAAVRDRIKDIGSDSIRAAATVLFELASEEDDNTYKIVDDNKVFETLAAGCSIPYEPVLEDKELSSETLHASLQYKQAPDF